MGDGGLRMEDGGWRISWVLTLQKRAQPTAMKSLDPVRETFSRNFTSITSLGKGPGMQKGSLFLNIEDGNIS